MGKEGLAEAVRGLDGNGWRVREELHPSTFTRARASLSLVREEAFRIGLGFGHAATLDTIL